MPTRFPASRTVLSLSALALLITGALLYAGPLDPPAGPVTSTGKTTQEIFDKVASAEPRTAINAANTPGDADSLFKITLPGSYYLTGNITGVVGKHGIEIAASGVSIDLAGFDLLGVAGSLDGISDTIGAVNVQVRNGSIRDWRDEGVDCTNSESASVSDVNVRNCFGIGIAIGRYGSVSRCSAVSNGAGGISTAFNCIVSACTVAQNATGGIMATTDCRVVDCTASTNAGSGISAGTGSTISGCAATDNGANGIITGNGCTVTNCSANSNNSNGISTGNGCTVVSCTARDNTARGISTNFNNSGIAVIAFDFSAVATCPSVSP